MQEHRKDRKFYSWLKRNKHNLKNTTFQKNKNNKCNQEVPSHEEWKYNQHNLTRTIIIIFVLARWLLSQLVSQWVWNIITISKQEHATLLDQCLFPKLTEEKRKCSVNENWLVHSSSNTFSSCREYTVHCILRTTKTQHTNPVSITLYHVSWNIDFTILSSAVCNLLHRLLFTG